MAFQEVSMFVEHISKKKLINHSTLSALTFLSALVALSP